MNIQVLATCLLLTAHPAVSTDHLRRPRPFLASKASKASTYGVQGVPALQDRASAGPYYLKDVDTLCPNEEIISDLSDCQTAVKALSKVFTNELEFQKQVTWNGAPNGCFLYVDLDAGGCSGCDIEKEAYYNTWETGFLGATEDCRPICKKKSPCENYCKNGGTCTLIGPKPQCTCPAQFQGEQCTENICTDTPSWTDGLNTCKDYEDGELCKNRGIAPGGSGGSKYNFPENNCCACGKSPGSSYTIANANLLCSDVNLEPIESLIECRNSVIDLKKSNPQIVFSEEEETQNFPKGCYIYEGTHIYWNKHSTGSRNALGRPVCNAAGSPYEKVNAGSLCSDERLEITSAEECKRAGESLGLTWGSAWDGPNDFPACLYAEDGRNSVYFNLSPNPERSNISPKYAAICKEVPKDITGNCDGTYDALKKEITSHDVSTEKYGNDESCSWTIAAPYGKVIVLTFESFDIEDHRNCNYDSLKVFVGKESNADKLSKTLCGSNTPAPIWSRGRFLHLQFTSDGSVTKNGFTIHYKFENEPADSRKVCKSIMISTEDYGKENRYTLGPCKSKNSEYFSHTYYFEDCCLAPGDYSLSCEDTEGDGWHGGYIKIDGVKYCDDFTKGYSKNVPINIPACDDTPNWKSCLSGNCASGCDYYRASRMCVDGTIFYTEEHIGEVTHKMMFEGDYNYPEQNCCGCGRIQGGCVDGDANNEGPGYVQCKDYYDHPDKCGNDDTASWKADEICCACRKKKGEDVILQGHTLDL